MLVAIGDFIALWYSVLLGAYGKPRNPDQEPEPEPELEK